MKAVIQRVSHGCVKVENRVTGEIDSGIAILLGIGQMDTSEDIKALGDKICSLRIFQDENGKMNLSADDIRGDFLIVSQFTLYGDCKKGRRPSFTKAAAPDKALKLYNDFVDYIRSKGFAVKTGEFGAYMEMEIVNSGPVTFVIDSKELL